MLLLGAAMAVNPARCLRIVTLRSLRAIHRCEAIPHRRNWLLQTRIVGILLIILSLFILRSFHYGQVIVPTDPYLALPPP